MAPLEIDNPFWSFSLRVYAVRGVAEECLELQDKLGLDVNVVLFAAWLGATQGASFQAGDLDRLERTGAEWSACLVQPLRAVRRKLKSMPHIADPEVQALLNRVAETELFSEQIEQALLYRLASDFGFAPGMPSQSAARANVATILRRVGGDLNAFPLHRLLAATTDATLKDG